MDENLINQTQEVQELDMLIDDVEDDIDTEEIVDVITVEQEEEVVIDIGESMGWVSGDNRYHDSLLGVDFPRQHPIEAITNLREELDEIERLKTVYSDKINIANYYKWKGAAYDTYGYFVSIVDGDKIQICDGKDIFGVVVKGGENPDAGFIGGQDTTPRDNTYGLVVTSGIVDVRCELDVDVGDYVISNSSGYAKKSALDYGYKVVGTAAKNGVPHATIALGVQADTINLIGTELSLVEDRVSINEKNIVSAINVSNQAYNMAESAASSASVSLGQVEDALKEILGFGETLDDIEKSVVSSSVISAQAKAIAESAATSAASMRDDAVKKANEALLSTDDLREELEAKAMQIGIQIYNATSELERAKKDIKSVRDDMQEGLNAAVRDIEDLAKDLEPLATWPEGATGDDIKGIAGFVAQANEDSATLADMVVWKDGDGDESLAGVVRKVTAENAEIQALASYKGSESSGAAGIMAEVDANKSAINAIASHSFTDEDGNTVAGLAGLQSQVDETKSNVSLVASRVNSKYDIIFKYTTDEARKPGRFYSKFVDPAFSVRLYQYYMEDGSWGGAPSFGMLANYGPISQDTVYYEELSNIYWYYTQDKGWAMTSSASEAGLPESTGGLQIVVSENKAQLDAMVSYDKDGKSALAGLTAYVDENSSEISTLASYSNENSKNSGTAGLIADVDNNTSALSLIADYSGTDENGTEFSGLAGLRAQVDNNKSELLNVADYTTGTNYTPTSYADGVSKTHNGVTYTVGKDGSITAAGFARQDSRFDIASWTNLVYPPDNIKLLIKGCPRGGSEDTYYIAALNVINLNDVHYDIGDGDTFMSKSGGCSMWIGIKAGTSADGLVFKPRLESIESNGLAAIKQSASRNSSSIDLLSSWKDEANINMARIEQKADANGAYIQSTVTNLDKYSVGPYSQAYGFTVEQADNVLEEGMIYVPIEDKIDDKKEIYKHSVISIDTWDVATVASKDTSRYYYAKDTKQYWYYSSAGGLKSWFSTPTEPSSSRSFVRGYLYQWSKIDSVGKWITVDKDYRPIENEDSADCTSGINISSMAVYFSTVEIAVGTGNNYGYWYTNGTDITTLPDSTATYEPYTLYKWDSYVDESGATQYHWVAVATLAGNYQSRAVSFIRQDANSIELSVTDLKGNYAGMREELTSTQASVQQLASWNEDDGEYMASVKTVANGDDGASVVITALTKNGGVVTEGASLTLNASDDGNSLVIDADNINLQGYVTMTNLSTEGQTTIHGGNIETDTISAITANLGTVNSGNLISPGYMEPVVWRGSGGVVSRTPSQGVMYEAVSEGTSGYWIVTGIGECTDTDIVLYSEISGYPVKQIATSAFSGNTNIKSVVIPNSITTIRWGAFWKCSNLQRVIFDEGSKLEYIGGYAFNSCTSLTSITIPSKVTDIREAAFAGCLSLEEINYNATNAKDLVYHHTQAADESLQNQVFFNAGTKGNGIKVTIGNNVTRIPSYLFCPKGTTDSSASDADKEVSGSPNIVSVEFEKGPICESIGRDAFYGCRKLKIFNISDVANWCNMEFGNEYASPILYTNSLYLNGELVTNLIIPDGVTSINWMVFRMCNNMVSVVVPDSVTTIGSTAFNYCQDLESIVIGSGVTKINSYAFNGDTKLSSVYYKGDSAAWSVIDKVDSYNDPLLCQATIYYYSENMPTGSGNYWHYEDGFKISCNDSNMIESRYFKVTQDGNISATSGNIGSWTVDNDSQAFYARNKIGEYWYGAGFDVGETAWSSETSDNYGVFAIGKYFGNDNSPVSWGSGDQRVPFMVTRAGKLMARDVELTGSITATEGKIGAWTVDKKTQALYARSKIDGVWYGAGFDVRDDAWSASSSDDYGVFAIGKNFGNDTNPTAWGGGANRVPFLVTRSGKLLASDAHIEGVLCATHGVLGTMNITGQIFNDTMNFGVIDSPDDPTKTINGMVLSGDNNGISTIITGNNIQSYRINCKNLRAEATLYCSGIWSISDIASNKRASIQFGVKSGDGISQAYTATASLYKSNDNYYISVSVDNNLLQNKEFTLKYYKKVYVKYIGNIKTVYTCKVNVLKGTNSRSVSIGQSTDDAEIVANEVYFDDNNKTTCTFSQTNDDSFQYIGVWGDLVPSNNLRSLGWTDKRWAYVHAKDITSETCERTTSDENAKNSIMYFDDKYENFFDGLAGKTFKLNEGTSNRVHTGFIAQEVEEALYNADLTTQEFAGICIDTDANGQQSYTLRYGEFIPINTWQIQKLKPRVSTLEEQVQALEERVQMLETENAELKGKIQMSTEESTELPQE